MGNYLFFHYFVFTIASILSLLAHSTLTKGYQELSIILCYWASTITSPFYPRTVNPLKRIWAIVHHSSLFSVDHCFDFPLQLRPLLRWPLKHHDRPLRDCLFFLSRTCLNLSRAPGIVCFGLCTSRTIFCLIVLLSTYYSPLVCSFLYPSACRYSLVSVSISLGSFFCLCLCHYLFSSVISIP